MTSLEKEITHPGMEIDLTNLPSVDLKIHSNESGPISNLARATENTKVSPNKILLIGGVGLKLLEAIINPDVTNNMFQSKDIDFLYLGTDKIKRSGVEQNLSKKLS